MTVRGRERLYIRAEISRVLNVHKTTSEMLFKPVATHVLEGTIMILQSDFSIIYSIHVATICNTGTHAYTQYIDPYTQYIDHTHST